MLSKWFIFFVFNLVVLSVVAQNTTISGYIKDEAGTPLELTNIFIKSLNLGTITNDSGYFELSVPISNNKYLVEVSFFGHAPKKIPVLANSSNPIIIRQSLKTNVATLGPVNITADLERHYAMIPIDSKLVTFLPVASGGIEALLKTMPGVASNNELSSQYSVRGGNFDENLVYVNDIEVYRPFLIRSGQQEGMSFVNPDMVSSVLFSAGGFEAKYGDKMSSVLDIRYKKPVKFAGSVSGSLLGGTAHIEGASKGYRFTHITGVRYKTSSYVLNSLDTKGDYKPSFFDFQTFMTYDITEKFELNILGNIAQNKYHFIPSNRETSVGTVNEALSLKIYFDGQEIDPFLTMLGAVSGIYKPNEDLTLKLIGSAFNTDEEETYDIQGQYYLNELDKELGSDNLGDSLLNIGIGTYLDHARNYLNASVYNITQKGDYNFQDGHNLMWGVKYQREIISDEINEWRMLDSSGHSLPFPDTLDYNADYINLSEVLITKQNFQTNRVTGFLQGTYHFQTDSSDLDLTLGVRGHYWDMNNQYTVSPRAILSFRPNWKRNFMFRLAAGYYAQPPFYKELRDLNGVVNKDIKAQQSIHFVLGSDYEFKIWNRPFKYITEIYYKELYNLIPYAIDNVRIRYYGTNNAKGYSTGIDMKINGEFVRGIESWASLSIMNTEENIEGDSYKLYYNKEGESVSAHSNDITDTVTVLPGYIPRPSDQRVNFSLFFQDYLPQNPTYKMHLSLHFGSRLPFGPPKTARHQDTLRMPPYRRVDIGFSKQLKKHNPEHKLNSLWVSLEVFNLLDINNTISHTWISDIYYRQYAIPNYLTGRRLNVKLIAKF